MDVCECVYVYQELPLSKSLKIKYRKPCKERRMKPRAMRRVRVMLPDYLCTKRNTDSCDSRHWEWFSDVDLSDAETVKGEEATETPHARTILRPRFTNSATGRIDAESNGSRSLAPVRDTRRDRLTIEKLKLIACCHHNFYYLPNKRPI